MIAYTNIVLTFVYNIDFKFCLIRGFLNFNLNSFF